MEPIIGPGMHTKQLTHTVSQKYQINRPYIHIHNTHCLTLLFMLVWKGNFAGLVSQSLFLVLKKKNVHSLSLSWRGELRGSLSVFVCLFV